MPTGEGDGQSFVVAGEATEAAEPAEGSFHHPALRQQHESPFGFMMFDDLQFDRRLLGRIRSRRAGISGHTSATGPDPNRRARQDP